MTQVVIGLKRGVGAADMVQHGAAPARLAAAKMRTGEIQRSQSGADDVVAELLHQEWRAGWCEAETSGKALKKQLVG